MPCVYYIFREIKIQDGHLSVMLDPIPFENVNVRFKFSFAIILWKKRSTINAFMIKFNIETQNKRKEQSVIDQM